MLTRDDGTRLLLGDVANVVDGFEEDKRIASFDGEPAVLVKVYRVGDQRVLDLADRAKDYVEEARARLPEGVHATVWRDGSQALRDRLDILVRNGRSGFVLVFVHPGALPAPAARVLGRARACRSRSSARSGAVSDARHLDRRDLALRLHPGARHAGRRRHRVGENVHRHQEPPRRPWPAAITGAQEVAVPVIFGVLTTVAAFLPLILAPGAIGQVFGAIGIVVICCLLFSLMESQLVLPAHLGHMKLERSRPGATGPPGGFQARWRRLQRAMATSLERLAERRLPAVARAHPRVALRDPRRRGRPAAADASGWFWPGCSSSPSSRPSTRLHDGAHHDAARHADRDHRGGGAPDRGGGGAHEGEARRRVPGGRALRRQALPHVGGRAAFDGRQPRQAGRRGGGLQPGRGDARAGRTATCGR